MLNSQKVYGGGGVSWSASRLDVRESSKDHEFVKFVVMTLTKKSSAVCSRIELSANFFVLCVAFEFDFVRLLC